MKKIGISFILLVFLAHNAFSKCASSGISVWPQTKKLSQNAVFIIEGFARSQSIITELNGKNRIYLKSINSSIALHVLRINKGDFGLTQAILKPVKKLIPGITYTLVIESLGEKHEKIYETDFKWMVSNQEDHKIPLWEQTPSYLSKEKLALGCGPERFVNFCVCFHDQSPVVVLTKLRHSNSGRVSQYAVIPDSTFLKIGHGMCSGAFDLKDGENYEVSFSLMDASGNVNKNLKEEFDFSAPSFEDKEEKPVSCNCNKIQDESSEPHYLLFIVAGLLLIWLLRFNFIWRQKDS